MHNSWFVIKMKSLELYVPLVYRIEGSHLVDSLPYIDEYTEADKKLVRDLIEAEQKTMPSKDYLEHYNTTDKEIPEVKDFVPFNFEVKTPECEKDYVDSVNNSKIAIEYLESKKINLELLNEFSKES